MKLFFRKLGIGYPLIILHGLYGASDNWITIANKLADYFEVYLLDAQNHGLSPNTNTHSYQEMKEDVLEFMQDNNLKKAIILGHSMGGKTAMLIANQYPSKITALVVVDIAPKKYSQENQNYKLHQLILQTLKDIDLQYYNNISQIEEVLIQKLNDQRLAKFLLKNIKRTPKNQLQWKLNVDAIYQNIENLTDGFSDINIKTISIPTMFFRGKNSDYITETDILKLKEIYLNLKITTIENAGHWLHVEQTDIFVSELLNFLLSF